MNNIKSIRRLLGLTQEAFGKRLGMTQGNVGHYELHKQEVPPDVARRIIAVAAEEGHILTFDDIYGGGERADETETANREAA